VSARGAWLTLDDGRRVFDGISSWWVNVHGHAHPTVAAAIGAQAASLDQVILADFTHGPAEALSDALVDILPGDLNHVFFSDDGSTAVEVALKMAWQAHQQRGDTGRTRLVAMDGGYHGDTLGGMRVGARGPFNDAFAGLLGDATFLPYGDADAAEAFFAAHGHEVCLCIAEPLVQCAGGMRFTSPDTLSRLAAAVQGAGAFLVLDEVATGFGRTGTMWACEQAGVVPDLLCMSKGITGGSLPLGVTACRPAIFNAFLGDDKRSAFLHGHSYTGNPIACAAALASLSVFRDEDTLSRVARITAQYAAAAPSLSAIRGVTDVRWMGGILALNLATDVGGYLDPVGRRVADAAFARGLYLRPLGDVVYLMPPYCSAGDDLAFALTALDAALRDVVA
jgi:adenosylmethionine-8-amino-7-oxononanoate aminotransferase